MCNWIYKVRAVKQAVTHDMTAALFSIFPLAVFWMRDPPSTQKTRCYPLFTVFHPAFQLFSKSSGASPAALFRRQRYVWHGAYHDYTSWIGGALEEQPVVQSALSRPFVMRYWMILAGYTANTFVCKDMFLVIF